jgi:hypothetical protein
MLNFTRLSSKQVDALNIGLMIISLGVAYMVPFELFLFSYAVLGPMHYLTEISWLHQRKYFVPGRQTFLYFALMTVAIGLIVLASNYGDQMLPKQTAEMIERWGTNLIFFVFTI